MFSGMLSLLCLSPAQKLRFVNVQAYNTDYKTHFNTLSHTLRLAYYVLCGKIRPIALRLI